MNEPSVLTGTIGSAATFIIGVYFVRAGRRLSSPGARFGIYPASWATPLGIGCLVVSVALAVTTVVLALR